MEAESVTVVLRDAQQIAVAILNMSNATAVNLTLNPFAPVPQTGNILSSYGFPIPQGNFSIEVNYRPAGNTEELSSSVSDIGLLTPPAENPRFLKAPRVRLQEKSFTLTAPKFIKSAAKARKAVSTEAPYYKFFVECDGFVMTKRSNVIKAKMRKKGMRGKSCNTYYSVIENGKRLGKSNRTYFAVID